MKEVNVNDFAVKLKISETRPAAATFKDETKRYFQHIEGMAGKDIQLSDLVNHDDRVILLHGIPGIGKSVFTKQLTFLWANNKIYTQFELCVVAECRDINDFVSNEGKEFEKHEIFSKFLRTKFEFELKDGTSTLFILDGVDELSDITADNCVIWQLLDIRHTKYPKAKIILTCRPHVEGRLERQDKDIGGLQKFEIQGLDDIQIKEYVNKFASCKEDIVSINKAIDASKEYIKILAIPEFLNSFCCVTLLSGGRILKSTAELYVWVLYLLLKEHVEKEGPSQKLCSTIFGEYLGDLRVLCEICHELLNENRIIFEGNVKSRLLCTGKGTEFLEELFVDLSDSHTEKYQFKHLTLMEFLSAVHICRMENRMEIIGKNLKNEFYQVVIFNCQLIGGCKYDGIIQDMLGNDEELKSMNVQEFLPSILNLVGQCIDYEQGKSEQLQHCGQLFQLSIEIIMCFINKDVTNKKFIISTVKALRYEMDGLDTESMRKVSEICKNLINEFKCTENDLKEIFENVLVDWVEIDDVKSLTCVKYLPNVERIDLCWMKTNVLYIRNEVNAVAKCKEVEIYGCELADDETDNQAIEDYELKELKIVACRLNRNSFFHLCNWTLASRVRVFNLYHMHNIEHSWWEYLANSISNEKSNESLALRELDIFDYTQTMSEEMQMKVRRFTY